MGADEPTGLLTDPRTDSSSALAAAVKEEALRVGFDLVGIAPVVAPAGLSQFREWLERGYHGEMEYLKRRQGAYSDPRHVLREARSIVMLAANYRSTDPMLADPRSARVSRYAWGDRDYHAVLRERLRALADFLHARRPGCRTRGVVDTAPILERDVARTAGLGWFGKNTMLIHKRQGSWLFLAALLTDVELPADAPHETSHCGTCTRCLDACPTQAFDGPYVLDARKCISYLTIELRGTIPIDLRSGMGDWLFGCDVCQDVCPWNRKSPVKNDPEFRPCDEVNSIEPIALLEMDAPAFESRFGDTALMRPGHAGMLRNACIVLGNRRQPESAPALARALRHSDPAVRNAAAWALGKVATADAIEALKAQQALEDNATVVDEIQQALAACLPSDTR